MGIFIWIGAILVTGGLIAFFIFAGYNFLGQIGETVDFVRDRKEKLEAMNALPEEERNAAKKKLLIDDLCIAFCVIVIFAAAVFFALM